MSDKKNWIWNDILSSQRLIITEATSRLLNYISIVLSITLDCIINNSYSS